MGSRPTAVAEGDRGVALAGSAQNALIITGDRNTVEMRLGGIGAVLAFAFRWNRPRRRRRRERRHGCPPRFENHVNRDDDVRALAGSDGQPRVLKLYGETGVGKTRVLVEALNRRESRMRDGTVYLDGRDQSADDLLHRLFDELYECRVPRRDLRVERLLSGRRAVVGFEDVDGSPEDVKRIVVGASRCRLLVTSERRVLFEGQPLKLDGLRPEYAVEIAEEELCRPLSAAERAAAEAISVAIGGHPLRLREAFGHARDEGGGRPLDELEPLLTQPRHPDELLAELTPEQRQVARALAVHGTEAVGVEHLRAMLGADADTAAAELERRHHARSHSPRYSLVGPLAGALAEADLSEQTDRALAYFTGWAEESRDPEAVLSEAGALLALLGRASSVGRAAEVVRLGRAIEGAFALGHRWAAWGRILELVLDAAQRSGDPEAEAWALHQLGTRAYGLGRAAEAADALREALALRERSGDREGAAATRNNLRVVTGRAPLLQRLSHASLLVLGVVAAVLIGAGGVASGLGGGGDGGELPSVRLTVVLDGDGRGAVIGDREGVRCEPRCEAHVTAGTELVLRPGPALGSEFRGWSGGGCAGRGPCRLVVDADTRVVAAFARVATRSGCSRARATRACSTCRSRATAA